MIDWTKIFNALGNDTVKDFVEGKIGYNQFERTARFTPASGQVRKLLRKGGISTARSLAKRACSRRGI